MTPDAIAAIPLFAISAAVIGHAWWATHKHPARQDGPEPLPERGSKPVPYHCATFGHYYRKAFADRWQCAQCGHTVPLDAYDDALRPRREGLEHKPERLANGCRCGLQAGHEGDH